MAKIHRFSGPTSHDFHCKDKNCEWPHHREHMTRSIEEAMEHIRETGHEIYFAVTEICSIMSDEQPIIALTAEDWARWRGMSASKLQELDIVKPDYI